MNNSYYEGWKLVAMKCSIFDILRITSTCHGLHKLLKSSLWQRLLNRDYQQHVAKFHIKDNFEAAYKDLYVEGAYAYFSKDVPLVDFHEVASAHQLNHEHLITCRMDFRSDELKQKVPMLMREPFVRLVKINSKHVKRMKLDGLKTKDGRFVVCHSQDVIKFANHILNLDHDVAGQIRSMLKWPHVQAFVAKMGFARVDKTYPYVIVLYDATLKPNMSLIYQPNNKHIKDNSYGRGKIKYTCGDSGGGNGKCKRKPNFKLHPDAPGFGRCGDIDHWHDKGEQLMILETHIPMEHTVRRQVNVTRDLIMGLYPYNLLNGRFISDIMKDVET